MYVDQKYYIRSEHERTTSGRVTEPVVRDTRDVAISCLPECMNWPTPVSMI